MKRENETGLPEVSDAIPDAGEIIYLSPEDQRRVAEAILNPPEPAEALVRAFERHSALKQRKTTAWPTSITSRMDILDGYRQINH